MKLLLTAIVAWVLAFSGSSFAQTFETVGAVTASTKGTDVAASDDAKSSWVQLTASTTIATKFAYCMFRNDGISNTPSGLIDVGVGAAASETVVFPDIFIEEGPSGAGDAALVHVPILSADIASSSRIAVRAEAEEAGGSSIYEAICILGDESVPQLTSPTHIAYGITSGSAGSKGTQVDPGATIHTKGAWAELTTSFSSTGEIVTFLFGNDRNGSSLDTQWLVDIGIGASSSETVAIENIHLGNDATVDRVEPFSVGPFPAAIFQGQRVSVRAQCRNNDAADRLIRVAAFVTAGTPVTAGGGGGGVIGGPNKRGGKQSRLSVPEVDIAPLEANGAVSDCRNVSGAICFAR